jgi:quercetin dioxygenase-like cupin family protein
MRTCTGVTMLKPALLLAMLTWTACAAAQDIEIIHADARTAARGPATAYTGVAIAEFMFLANEKSDLAMGEISFEPGARTGWHSHHAGQYLVITSGVGWMQARGEKKRLVKAGDVVWTPPGVFHWHGATTTQGLRHLAIWKFVDGSGGEVGELVTDAEYLSELAAE